MTVINTFLIVMALRSLGCESWKQTIQQEPAGMGQGGSSFELERVFANKKLALHHVPDKPMVAIE